ncbi:MAG: arginine--tRNA ligase [Oscillospiraceae bacterium]|nr:arginine--tRNA ligase [Oscillospiraceae bacterium]
MTSVIEMYVSRIKEFINNAIESAYEKGELPSKEIPDYLIEIPADTNFGDFAANIAMVGARSFKTAPRKIAEAVISNINTENTGIEKIEIAGPGFINFFVNMDFFASILSLVKDMGENYGRVSVGNGKKLMVEFVSANPTGPMHIGNARGGALGDCLASVLDWAGYDVTREFYVNDAGNQIEKFANSLDARYLQIYKGDDIVFPEDGYHGEDIKVHAKNFSEKYGDAYVEKSVEERKKALVDYALPLNIEKLHTDLAAYRINYDVWFKESSLYKQDAVNKVVKKLTEKGLTYEKEGAIWLKSTEFGSEKDDVLVRANGFATYFAADIAYHYNKFIERGFQKVINIWGADHHGHVARLKGAMEALGVAADGLDIVLMQLVRLMRGGETVKVSKRTGKSITLSDLLEEVPVNAARFFFNLRDAGTHLDFDMELAVEESSQNPVYYVQYAHARICSIIANMKKENRVLPDTNGEVLKLLKDSEEKELIRLIGKFPEIIKEAAKSYDPSKITKYAVDVATLFHKFYNACRVNCEEDNLAAARLELCLATKQTLKNVSDILKIDAPESM